MQQDLFDGDLERMEHRFETTCAEFAGESASFRIRGIDLDAYELEVEAALQGALQDVGAAAVYFEYDMDNDWQSRLFAAGEYRSVQDGDEDWAADWIKDLEGPALPRMAEIYAENGFDRTPEAMAVTLYLVARTTACFARACRRAKSSIPLCIAFHDQDPIMRVRRDSN